MIAAASLEAQIEKTEQQIEALRKTHSDRRQSIAKVEAERRNWLIAARADNDPKAQKEIEKRADQIAAMREEDDLDCAAIAELEDRLKAQKADLEGKHRRDECLKAVSLIAPHVEGKAEERLLAAAHELKNIMQELDARDTAINNALAGLGARFHGFRTEFPYKQRNRRNAVENILREVIPGLRGGWGGNVPAEATGFFGKCIESLREECDNAAAAA
jgi:hypothetical protein